MTSISESAAPGSKPAAYSVRMDHSCQSAGSTGILTSENVFQCLSKGRNHTRAPQVAPVVKNPPASAGDVFDPWVRKILWRRAWQPTRVLLPGETHGQRSLVGCSSWGHKESEMTEQLTLSLRTLISLALFCSMWDLSSLTWD